MTPKPAWRVAILQRPGEIWLATSGSRSPNDGRGVDLAIFTGICTHSSCRLRLNAEVGAARRWQRTSCTTGRGATAGDDRKMNNEPLEREPIDRMRARLEALLKANAAARCGARSKRTGKPCRGAAMPNGRCKLHGGKSTGPRTMEGLERSRRANWKHGHFSREAKAERSRLRAAILVLRYLRMLGH